MSHYDVIIVGCGLSGAVLARQIVEKTNKKVLILERRSHIGGNMYDYRDSKGLLVQQYGPHTFHTNDANLMNYMCRFEEWDNYILTCGAVIDGKYTPTPFNFQTIDDFYSKEKALKIKSAILECYGDEKQATVLELLNHENDLIREYAEFLFEKDYSLYTAKQWGVSPKEIDPSVLRRVPIRFSYDEGYFNDKFQVMPHNSFSCFFENILKHPRIECRLNTEAMELVSLDEQNERIRFNGEEYVGDVIFTGPIDELFGFRYGVLPYRSLRFEWKSAEIEEYQSAPVVAYPEEKFTRITEYSKLPVQKIDNYTSYAIEYSIPYTPGEKVEPYYPVLTEDSNLLYMKYVECAKKYDNLFLCGRLANFKYYNMDQALENALSLAQKLINKKG